MSFYEEIRRRMAEELCRRKSEAFFRATGDTGFFTNSIGIRLRDFKEEELPDGWSYEIERSEPEPKDLEVRRLNAEKRATLYKEAQLEARTYINSMKEPIEGSFEVESKEAPKVKKRVVVIEVLRRRRR